MTKQNYVDLSAKLLASENISIARARVRTASFDVKSRVLTLPAWKEMTPVIEGMLVGHEVGHALYTTEEFFDEEDHRKIFGYLNVLEDVRIEKLMKRKFPGIRKTMNDGYKELNDRDFFGVQKTDITTLNLIDRINLYFKAGFSSGVKFAANERDFVTRAEKTETVQDVIGLAREIYEFSKEQIKEQVEQRLASISGNFTSEEDQDDQFEDDAEDEEFHSPMDFDDEGEKIEEELDELGSVSSEKKKSSRGKTEQEKQEELERKVEEELAAKTDKSFYSKLEELADDSTDYKYVRLDTDYFIDPLVTYKTVLQETAELDTYQSTETRASFDKFKMEASRVVNYLVKEFEMRKSAQLYKRSKVSKMGSLDMRKVWAYKLNDDLFKRVTTIPEGKNHGMVFLLDWSGSMDGLLKDTVKQVLTLAMFCQRAQIPFRVFAFSSQYSHWDELRQKDPAKFNALRAKSSANPEDMLNNCLSDFAMLEFLSSKMSNVEFNIMARRLYETYLFRTAKHHQYSTSGTPLNEALAYMLQYLPKFIQSSGIEKLSFITLTDGEGQSLWLNGRYGLADERIERIDGVARKINQKYFIRDEQNKKTYSFSQRSTEQTDSLLRMIKDKFNAEVVGFYICDNHRNRLSGAIHANLAGFTGDTWRIIEDMRKEFRDQGFYSMKNTGRDDLFIIPASSLRVDDSEVTITENQSAKQIARAFSKVMSGRKTSRVLLNKFIGYVA